MCFFDQQQFGDLPQKHLRYDLACDPTFDLQDDIVHCSNCGPVRLFEIEHMDHSVHFQVWQWAMKQAIWAVDEDEHEDEAEAEDDDEHEDVDEDDDEDEHEHEDEDVDEHEHEDEDEDEYEHEDDNEY